MEEQAAQQMLAAIEKAAQENESADPTIRTAAEKTLLSFKEIPEAIVFAKFILQRSSLDVALYHTLLAIRHSFLKQWPFIPLEAKLEIRPFLLKFALEMKPRGGNVENLQRIVCHVVACISKRGLLDQDFVAGFRQQMLELLFSLLQQQQQPQVLHLGLTLMRELCEEFGVTHSTDLNLPWQFHYRCMKAFENHELKRIFEYVVQMLSAQFEAGALSSAPLKLCVALLNRILSEYFAEQISKAQIRTQITELRPHRSWRPLLIESHSLLLLMLRVSAALRSDTLQAHYARGSLLQLASITGEVFDSAAERTQFQMNFLQGLTQLLLTPIVNSTVSGVSSEELSDLSQIFARVLHCAADQRAVLVRSFPEALLQQFVLFTCRCLETSSSSSSSSSDAGDDSLMQLDAFQHMADSWVLILESFQSSDRSAASSEAKYQYTPLPKLVSECGGHIYGKFVEWRWNSLHKESLDDDLLNEEELNCILTVSYVGRAHPEQSLQLLLRLLHQTLAAYQMLIANHAAKTGVKKLEKVFDQLELILRLSGQLLADDKEGDNPQIPDPILHTVQAHELVIHLVGGVLNLTEVENKLLSSEHQQPELLSPVVGKMALWFLERFAQTYLMPNETPLIGKLQESYGSGTRAAASVLDFVISKVFVNLACYSAETEVILQSANLLLALSKLRHIRPLIALSGCWTNFRAFYRTQHRIVKKISSKAKRRFYQALVKIALSNPNPTDAQNDFLLLMHPVGQTLVKLTSANFVAIAHNAETIIDLSDSIDLLRGMARASETENWLQLFSAAQPFLISLPQLLPVYQSNHSIVASVLNFYANFAKTQIDYLDTEKLSLLFGVSNQLLTTFGTFAREKLSDRKSKALQKDSDEELYEDLLAAFRLLHTFASHIFFVESAIEVTLQGLYVLLPLLNKDLLRIPHLSSEYFGVISAVCSQPQRVVTLPPQLFEALVASLEAGLASDDPLVPPICFESLASIATFEFSSGKKALANQRPGVLESFLEPTFRTLVQSTAEAQELSSATNLFFALICIFPERYQQMVSNIVSLPSHAPFSDQLIRAFEALVTADSITLSAADPKNQAQFRKNMEALLTQVRSLLRMK